MTDEPDVERATVPEPTLAGRTHMKKTIRQLREERRESEQQLAVALGATLLDIQDLGTGVATP